MVIYIKCQIEDKYANLHLLVYRYGLVKQAREDDGGYIGAWVWLYMLQAESSGQGSSKEASKNIEREVFTFALFVHIYRPSNDRWLEEKKITQQ